MIRKIDHRKKKMTDKPEFIFQYFDKDPDFMRLKMMIILFLFGTNFVCPLPAQEKQILNLDELIAEALQNNPQLQAAKNNAAASRATIRQAASWEAPEIGMEFRQTPVKSFPNPVKNGMETDYYLQQMIPFPGKLAAMSAAAKSGAAMAEQEYHALRNIIIRRLKTVYYEIYLVQHKIKINAENQDLMKKFVGIAIRQYEVGMALQPDVLRAQTELSLLVNEGVTLQREEKVAESMLNALLNRPIDQPLGEVDEIMITVPNWEYQQLSAIALETRPEIKAMKLAIRMNEAEIKAAKREYWPDLMGRIVYMDMADADDFWSLMLGMNIPITFWSGDKYTGKVEQNKFRLNKAEADIKETVNMVSFELREALVKVETNHNLLSLYEGALIPQAEQTLQSTLAAYQTGKTMFLMLIDAYRMLNMVRLDYYMAEMNYMNSLAALEQAVGLEIDEIGQRIDAH
jgi:outer membrane protein TolC